MWSKSKSNKRSYVTTKLGLRRRVPSRPLNLAFISEQNRERRARLYARRGSARGRSSSTRSCSTLGVMRPRRVRGGPGRSLHCPQCARQVGLGLTSDPGQLVERAGRLLCDNAKQLAIAGRQELGESLRRSKPDLRLVAGNAALAAPHRHRACLHLLIARDADLQRGNRSLLSRATPRPPSPRRNPGRLVVSVLVLRPGSRREQPIRGLVPRSNLTDGACQEENGSQTLRRWITMLYLFRPT